MTARCFCRTALFPAAAFLLTSAAVSLPSGAWRTASAASQSAKIPPASKSEIPLLEADNGKFSIQAGGAPVGAEDFQISSAGAEWIARAHSEIRQPGAPATEITATLRLAPDGSPLRYEWKMEGAKKASSTVEFSGAKATVDLRVEGAKPFVQQFDFSGRRVVILDDNIYSQYAILAWLYDARVGGTQSFAVLVPQEMTPGSITVESLGPQEIAGHTYTVLRARTADLELHLLLDGRRLMRILVPAASAEISRQ